VTPRVERHELHCRECGGAFFGRTDARYCCEACKKRAKRKREGAGTPERKQRRLDGIRRRNDARKQRIEDATIDRDVHRAMLDAELVSDDSAASDCDDEPNGCGWCISSGGGLATYLCIRDWRSLAERGCDGGWVVRDADGNALVETGGAQWPITTAPARIVDPFTRPARTVTLTRADATLTGDEDAVRAWGFGECPDACAVRREQVREQCEGKRVQKGGDWPLFLMGEVSPPLPGAKDAWAKGFKCARCGETVTAKTLMSHKCAPAKGDETD